MNNVCLVGGLTADARINEGKTVASFNLGVSRPFKNKEGKYDSDFIKCKLFGENAVKAFSGIRLTCGDDFPPEGQALPLENPEASAKPMLPIGQAVLRSVAEYRRDCHWWQSLSLN